jgi:CubicO group peptidase (beta-lactamase class C family)
MIRPRISFIRKVYRRITADRILDVMIHTRRSRQWPAARARTAQFLSGSGGLFSTAEDYLKFADMLLNNGKWNGTQILSPRTVQPMTSNQVGKLYEMGTGPAPTRGQGWGFGVRVVEDSTRTPFPVSNESFGWIGVFGTQFWVDPKEKLVTILMVQTLDRAVSLQLQTDFHAAVMKSLVPGR